MGAIQEEVEEGIAPLNQRIDTLTGLVETLIKLMPERMLDTKEAAEIMNCKEETIRRRVRAGTLKCTRIGNQIRIHPKDLIK